MPHARPSDMQQLQDELDRMSKVVADQDAELDRLRRSGIGTLLVDEFLALQLLNSIDCFQGKKGLHKFYPQSIRFKEDVKLMPCLGIDSKVITTKMMAFVEFLDLERLRRTGKVRRSHLCSQMDVHKMPRICFKIRPALDAIWRRNSNLVRIVIVKEGMIPPLMTPNS